MNDSGAASQLVAQIKENWRRGETRPDTAAALCANPHLGRWKSIVLDLAAAEFELRAARGQQIAADDFCRRFPDYQRSLLHRLEVEQYLWREEARQALDWPEPGTIFLGYRLLQQLGKGAVGRVFLAQQIEMRDRLVVIKVAPHSRREADTLALLNHPHIVPVYRYDEDLDTGLAVICMPFLSRTTLDDLVAAVCKPSATAPRLPPTAGSVDSSRAARDQDWPPADFPALLEELRQRFPVEELNDRAPSAERAAPGSYAMGVLDLGRQLADALAHTHHRGVLHLDLKPSNVLLLPDGRPMLLDFNLSVEGMIGASVIGGTLPYMSPEQLQEAVLGRSYRSRPVDGRSDIFSLGVMLYELLAGRHPFGEIPRTRDPREAAKELLRRHEAGPDALLERYPRLDREATCFVESCLAYHPDQRPATAEDVSLALRRLQTPQREKPRPVALGSKWVAPGKLLAAAGGCCALGGVLLGATWTFFPPASATVGELAAKSASRPSAVKDSRSVEAWEALGHSQREQKQYREAVASFQRAWELSNDPRFKAEIGHCWYQTGELELAEGWHKEACKDGFESADLHVDLSQFYSRQQRFDEAKMHADAAVALEPESLRPRRNRALLTWRWFLQTRRPQDLGSAPEDIRLAVRLAPHDAKLLFQAASIHAVAAPTPDNEQWVQTYLTQARDQGALNSQSLRSGDFGRFHGRPWLQELMTAQAN